MMRAGGRVDGEVAAARRGCESPEFVRLSTAAAISLGLKSGRFYRNARLHCLNLLLTYEEGCLGRCAYCGLSGERACREGEKNFIRVEWPTHALADVLGRMRPCPEEIERVCVSMVTRRRAAEDAKAVVRAARAASHLPISVLVAPTLVGERDCADLREAGADRVGIAVDAATPALFDRFRGRGVGGPHHWDAYWASVETAVRVFGEGRAGVHLIVGLGETEREMVETVRRARDLGARTHLFSFYPEKGSALADAAPPPVGQYRRVQLARFVIDEGLASARDMRFGSDGRIEAFGLDGAALDSAIASGLPFRTSGCPGRSDVSACNRPYANSPPPDIRNFPFPPDDEDIAVIRSQLWC